MRTRLVSVLVLLGALVPGVSASAAIVPPGNSAATQYSETVPAAGGEASPTKNGQGGKTAGKESGAPESAVPATTAADLEELGPEGEAVLKLTGTGPPRKTKTGAGSPQKAKHKGKSKHKGAAANPDQPGGPSSGGGGPSGGGVPPATSGSSAAGGSSGPGEVFGAAAGTSVGGLGFFQPLILVAVLIAAGAYLVRRRRVGSADQTDMARR